MDERLPDRIGPYTIVGVLGEGGSGRVYLAEQSEPLKRTVAIKVLESIDRSERTLVRFEIERLALAVMDHPSIAKVHDAGVTEDGHPYVVMERVDGMPIGQYCDDRRLTIRQRVALFAEACRAVHHAHQKGVIHRDLKPSHLLVTEVDGRPRLRIIDFGIAMALEEGGRVGLSPDDAEVVGTPGYMSPEQMEGSADIDTRSDIYSLGILLYELLVGVPPFEPGRRRGWAAVAAQLEDLPTPTRRLVSLDDTQDTLANQRRTTPRGLRRALHGDLDSIVSRAMAKDRDTRYETAKELWQDLERYLADEPVEARDGGPVYRARKFARRHRVGVTIGALILVALTAVGSTAAIQAARVAEARDEAAQRRAQAEALVDFMLTDLRERLEPIGRLDVLDAVGEEALAYFAATPERDVSDRELFRRVRALQLIGDVRVGQGDLPAARRAFEGALAVNADLVERAPDNAEWLAGLGASHFWVGFVDWRVGDLDAAVRHFEDYRAISEELVARDPDDPAWQAELAYSHSNLGSVHEDRGALDAALDEFSAAAEIFESIAAAEPGNTTWRLNLADTRNTLGDVLLGLGRLAEARDAHAEEVRIKQGLVDEDPANADFRARLATAHNYLGYVIEAQGDLGTALGHYERAVTLWRALVARDETHAQWRRNLAMNQHKVASVHAARGDPAGALARLEPAVATLQALGRSDPSDPGWRRDEAVVHVEVARVLHDLGRPAAAGARAEEALAIIDGLLERTPGRRDLVRLRAEALNVLGLARASSGDTAGARDAWTDGASVLEPVAAASRDPRDVAPRIRSLLHLDRADEARPLVTILEDMGYRDDVLARVATEKGITNALGARSAS